MFSGVQGPRLSIKVLVFFSLLCQGQDLGSLCQAKALPLCYTPNQDPNLLEGILVARYKLNQWSPSVYQSKGSDLQRCQSSNCEMRQE